MRNPDNYKSVIAELSGDYFVFYPYSINLRDADAGYIFQTATVAVICILIASLLIVVSLFVLKRNYAGRIRQNAILLSLGYSEKRLTLANILETAILTACAVVVNVVIVGICRLIRDLRTSQEDSFIPFGNLSAGLTALLCTFTAAVYLLYFWRRFNKSNGKSVNQIIKSGGAE
jgi:hypothetical protein